MISSSRYLFKIASAIALGSSLYCPLLMLCRKLSTWLWRTSGRASACVARELSVTLSCDRAAGSPARADSGWLVADAVGFFACSAATDCGSVVFNPILISNLTVHRRTLIGPLGRKL